MAAVPRPAADAELVSEREHVDEVLASYALWQLGASLSEADGSPWRLLADLLGLTVDQIAGAASRQPDNPGYGALLVWSARKNSTIGVLRRTLADELKRRDLVELLDKARQSRQPDGVTMISAPPPRQTFATGPSPSCEPLMPVQIT